MTAGQRSKEKAQNRGPAFACLNAQPLLVWLVQQGIITCRGCVPLTCAQSGSGLREAKDLRPVFTCR